MFWVSLQKTRTTHLAASAQYYQWQPLHLYERAPLSQQRAMNDTWPFSINFIEKPRNFNTSAAGPGPGSIFFSTLGPGRTSGKFVRFFYEIGRKRWVYRSLPSRLGFIARWWLTLPYVWVRVWWMIGEKMKSNIFFYKPNPPASRASYLMHT